MCGRVIQASGLLRLAIVDGLDVRDSRLTNVPRRYNGAPSQELLVIRQNHQTGERSLDFLKWGLIPYWCKDPKGGRKPINAKAETISRLPMFRDAYVRRRCIVPVDGFFEWKAIKGQRAKQPYAIAMRDGAPVCGSGGFVCSWALLIRGAQRARCQVPVNPLCSPYARASSRPWSPHLSAPTCRMPSGAEGVRARPRRMAQV